MSLLYCSIVMFTFGLMAKVLSGLYTNTELLRFKTKLALTILTTKLLLGVRLGDASKKMKLWLIFYIIRTIFLSSFGDAQPS